MHEHEYYQELMSRLLDEGLTAEEEASLRAHVRACPECRQMFTAFTGISSVLRDDDAEPPRDLARGVMERIADEGGERRPRSRRKKPRRSGASRTVSPWVRLGAAACLVLLAAGGVTLALRGGRTASDTAETAESRSAGESGGTAVYQQAAPTEEEDAGVPMMISAQDAAADPAQTAAADMAAASAGAEAPTPTPEPDQPLPVYDAARTRIGAIPPENIPAFAALITDDGWAEGSFEYLLKVTYRGKTYAFATDDHGGLVWWEEPSTQPLRSPGTLADLHALIALDAPALPE